MSYAACALSAYACRAPCYKCHTYLWCHVVQGAHPADGSLLCGVDGQPKVPQAQGAVVLKKDVFRLDVPVDDAQLVQGVQHLQQWSHHLAGSQADNRQETTGRQAYCSLLDMLCSCTKATKRKCTGPAVTGVLVMPWRQPKGPAGSCSSTACDARGVGCRTVLRTHDRVSALLSVSCVTRLHWKWSQHLV